MPARVVYTRTSCLHRARSLPRANRLQRSARNALVIVQMLLLRLVCDVKLLACRLVYLYLLDHVLDATRYWTLCRRTQRGLANSKHTSPETNTYLACVCTSSTSDRFRPFVDSHSLNTSIEGVPLAARVTCTCSNSLAIDRYSITHTKHAHQ